MSPHPSPLKSRGSFETLKLASPILGPTLNPSLPRDEYPDINSRRTLFRRIAHLNSSFGARERSTTRQGGDIGEENEPDLHWEAIERILFIYAKLNPAIGYVQGMNELIAPLYYVLQFIS
jgi:Rab-GTPase-TBC domain